MPFSKNAEHLGLCGERQVAHLKSPVLGDKGSGLGATHPCDFYDSTSVMEKIINTQPGKSVTPEVSKFSMPLNRMAATIALIPTASGPSEVTFRADYEMKF